MLFLDAEPNRVVVVVVERVDGGCGPLVVLFVAGAAGRLDCGEKGRRKERRRDRNAQE